MNKKDLSGIAIVIKMILLTTAGKQFTTLTGIRGKLLDREGRLISRKIKETINFWKNPNQIFKTCFLKYIYITCMLPFPTCFLKYIFLIYGSSWLLIYVTSVNSNWWHLSKPITFASVKVYCLINLICLIILISHIAQLLLIRIFYCFRPGRHISLKYAQHNHLLARWWE